MLCGDATYAGDYDKLNCLKRGKPATYICGDMKAEWIKPKSTLLHNNKETKEKGHWIVENENGQGHVGLDGSWVKGETKLTSLNVVKSVLDLGRDFGHFGADVYFEIRLLGTLLRSESRALCPFWGLGVGVGLLASRHADWCLLPM